MPEIARADGRVLDCERVVKETGYVIAIQPDGSKITIPWQGVDEVRETIEKAPEGKYA